MKSTASDVLFVIEVQNRIFMNTHTSSLMDCFDEKKVSQIQWNLYNHGTDGTCEISSRFKGVSIIEFFLVDRNKKK